MPIVAASMKYHYDCRRFTSSHHTICVIILDVLEVIRSSESGLRCTIIYAFRILEYYLSYHILTPQQYSIIMHKCIPTKKPQLYVDWFEKWLAKDTLAKPLMKLTMSLKEPTLLSACPFETL